ncbi:MAG TPA: hypothetical protein VFO73_05840, partial [Candidatus Limnocylindrales bacterium]|nr:hypothetical protein [Candidatus Limnocylindrales bacterium]
MTDTEETFAVAETAADATADWPSTDQAVDRAPVADAEPPDDAPQAHEAEPASSVTAPEPATRPAPRKPSKFLADLTKAMQAAAEESRAISLTQFEAEAKAYIEQIRNRSGDEAAGLRRAADDDVQAVREWSKAEIARIREETETRITARKGQLESDIEAQGARIEREVAQVQGRVTAFEEEMAAFFERLLQEDDPTRFATMAERLPEPPTFEEMSASTDYSVAVETEPEAVVEDAPAELVEEAETAEEAVAEEAVAEEVEEAEPVAELTETVADVDGATDTGADTDTTVEGSFGAFESAGSTDGVEIDREAAMAAIQAAAEAAASAEVASDAAARAEAVADIAIEIVGQHEDDSHLETDPRATALGLTPDFDAAEAEAFASAGTDEGEEIPEIGDEALAARLAGLTPSNQDDSAPASTTSTQVVVVGLVSVASIASFKRHLGRMAGVRSVGVSSGPDGEFLFAVTHASDLALRDVIPAMPSFQARVT